MLAAKHTAFSWTLGLGLAAACTRESGGQSTVYTPEVPEAAARPRLVVLLVVDQMRADYLSRYADLYTGGLHRLRQQGALFEEAHIQHALTFTAPGHASASTATHPSHHGIIENEWYDRSIRKKAYAADDKDARIVVSGQRAGSPDGRSPEQLMRPAIGDWLKEQVPKARVFAVAFKDRASVMMGGQHPDRAYWFDAAAAGYVSSSWYGESLPAWVADFNGETNVFRRFAEGWQRLRDAGTYARSGADKVEFEADGVHSELPHAFDDGSPQARDTFLKELQWTPFGDELTLAFAQRMLKEEQLGVDADPDILLVSCSSADYVGHRYGPMSHEAQDYYMRLDGYLDVFLRELDTQVGAGNYVLALTADHGAIPIPELLKQTGQQKDARRVVMADYKAQVTQKVGLATKALNLPPEILLDIGETGVWLDVAAAEAKGVGPEQLRAAVGKELAKLDFVAEVFTADVLSGTTPDTGASEFLERYRRSFFPTRSPDVTLRFKEWTLAASYPSGTSHGSPYRYDTHVPVLFFGAKVVAKTLAEPVGTVDVAPTLAEFLGIQPPAQVDGRSLASLVTTR
ncbi:alkaline phosphatase family protein [Nannocystis sp. ILAH1]|uniref:alkaline phosphatase family protein n=1 Tax=unclassified Nannocystis TaxID=2627009 RepID=UPI00226E7AAB|nr:MULTISPECIES: alkaline phosphatase family protein [unclassified Nannocystis]MCY0988482.1 alkaline phosphatase family protein [Nannocystis sp. ILAH1]MCY1067556.1 alkaline phosphatase family protein [Nannocystis sp. RBIL2]